MKSPLKNFIALAVLLSNVSLFGQFLSENFESSTFPPTNWMVKSTNANQSWKLDTKTSSEGVSSASVLYDDALGDQNETLISPAFDLSTAITPVLEFSFSMSYYWSVSPNDNYNFTVSINDGTTTTVLWTEADKGNFNNYEWYQVTLDLTPYVGKSNLKLEFNYTGKDGADLNLDNISVSETAVLSVGKVSKSTISFYPNPTTDILSFNSVATIDKVTFYNTNGQMVYTVKPQNNQIDISQFNAGVYLLKVASDQKVQTYQILKK